MSNVDARARSRRSERPRHSRESDRVLLIVTLVATAVVLGVAGTALVQNIASLAIAMAVGVVVTGAALWAQRANPRGRRTAGRHRR